MQQFHLLSPPKRHSSSAIAHSKGVGLIELMIAIAILGIIVVTLAEVLEFTAITSTKSREQTYAANISQRFFTRLNNIPYPYIFSCDSSSPSYRLTGTFGPVTNQVTPYPYMAVFRELDSLLRANKFDRFTVDVKFMIRDLGDLDSDGQTTDLRYFTDANGDNIDDYDSGLLYFNQNGDGDFLDTYGTPETTEEPHTRLKEVTLKIYKKGQVVFQDVQLVSWEKFTGVEGKAAGATLSLVISTPSENSYVYSLGSTAQQDSYSLVLQKPHSSEVVVQRADASVPLRIVGETTPNATLSWKLKTSTDPTIDTCVADVLGSFNCSVSNITNSLDEGTNKLFGQATKDVYYSPWNSVTFIREISVPTIQSQTPSGTVKNKQPLVRAMIADQPVTAGRTVSDIDASVITLFCGTQTVNYQYDLLTDYVTWLDSTTNLPPILSTGSYTMVLEGGDNAKYNARSTWTFTVDIDFTDHSEPSVSNKVPSGWATSNPPPISCRVFDNQSGIDINSIVMSLDDAVVISSVTGNLLSSYAPLTQQDGGTVSYTPSSSLSSGQHKVVIQANHWATNPLDRITKIETWYFDVP